jgi:hypothetical protein
MPKFVSKELSDDLYARLCGRFVDRYLRQVVLLYTVDLNGWPHPSVLSYFEVVARDRTNIRLATYKNSSTTENMRRNHIVTLSLFDDRIACSIKGRVEEIRNEMRSAPHNSILNVAIDQVLLDEADPVLEPGAHISSGISCVNAARKDGILKELIEG